VSDELANICAYPTSGNGPWRANINSAFLGRPTSPFPILESNSVFPRSFLASGEVKFSPFLFNGEALKKIRQPLALILGLYPFLLPLLSSPPGPAY